MSDDGTGRLFTLTTLHERVVAGDPLAPDELARLVLKPLQIFLTFVFRHAPRDLIVDAATDAVLDYLRHPQQFRPARGFSLEQFLRYASKQNLIDLLRAETRRKVRETRFASDRPLLQEPQQRFATDLYRLLTSLCPPLEMDALRLWLKGERDTTTLAMSLNLSHLTCPQQRKAVKRWKDPIAKRLRRHPGSDTR